MNSTDDIVEQIGQLLAISSVTEYKASEANFRIGGLLSDLCIEGGEEMIHEAAALLHGRGRAVKAEFLFDALRVFRSIKSEDTLRKISSNLHGRLPWSFLVNRCTKVPEGSDEVARVYWEQQFSRIENSMVSVGKAAEKMVEHMEQIPEPLRPHAEGVLAALGQQIEKNDQPSIPCRKTIRTILHIGDEHFDDGELLSDVIKSAQFIVGQARQLQPDLIVSSGDMLDTRQSHDSQALKAAMAFVKDLAEIAPVFILKGTTSHDGVSVSFFESLGTKHRVCVTETIGMVGYKNGEFFPLESYEKGLDALIYAIPPATKARIMAGGEGMKEANGTVADMLRSVFTIWGDISEMARADNVPVIVSGHGTITGAITSTGQKMVGRDIEVSLGDLLLIGADVVCFDHIHKAQAWHKERIFYSGSIAKLNVGETEDKGFWVHRLTPEDLRSDFVVIPTRDIVSTSFEGLPDISALPEVKEGALVRICYRVQEGELHAVDEVALKAKILAMGAGEVRIEKTVVPKQMVRAAGISRLSSLPDKFKKWCETTGTEVTDTLLEKLELLALPKDVLFMELQLPLPMQRRKK